MPGFKRLLPQPNKYIKQFIFNTFLSSLLIPKTVQIVFRFIVLQKCNFQIVYKMFFAVKKSLISIRIYKKTYFLSSILIKMLKNCKLYIFCFFSVNKFSFKVFIVTILTKTLVLNSRNT